MNKLNKLDKIRKLNKSSFENLANDTKSDKANYADDRIWSLQVDKDGTGSAEIRFLPNNVDDTHTDPWALYYRHSFKSLNNNRLWYIENCRTSIGESDPVCDCNKKLFESDIESNKVIGRLRKRKATYMSNILVINDPSNSENNGKVFLFRYGKSIFDMIKGKACPKFEDDEAVNVFDFWEGANFKIRRAKIEGWPNYRDSKFLEKSALYGDDNEKYNVILDKLYPLSEFLKESFYKPYDKLMERFLVVTGEGDNDGDNMDDIEDNVVVNTNHTSKPNEDVADIPTESKSTTQMDDTSDEESSYSSIDDAFADALK